MKSFSIIIFLVVIFSCNNNSKQLIDKIYLDINWTFNKVGEESAYNAYVPGTIQTDLWKNKLISDPYYGCNEIDLQWIGESDWCYKSKFVLKEEDLIKDNISIVFEGLDTYAKVILNGTIVLNANNMHHKWVVPCKDILVSGENTIEIVFESPVKYYEKDSINLDYEIPGGKWAYTRKAAYHYGWDWAPSFLTMGIIKPIYLILWDNHYPKDFYFTTVNVEPNIATLKLSFDIESKIKEEANIKVSQIGRNKILFENSFLIDSINSSYNFYFNIDNPKLWWCNGMGESYIYELKIELETKSGLIHQEIIPYGIKTLKTYLSKDSIGEKLYIELNGIPIFIKGTNYVPQNSFITEVSDNDLKEIIDIAKNCNMNMLRVWGGGIYQNDFFYEYFNRNGILIWQDFMFACSMYPSNNEFKKSIKEEAIYQVKKLRKHSNIALLCGNNEIEEGWNNWGWQKKIDLKTAQKIYEGYEHIFKDILPSVINKYDSSKFYLTTSPLFGWGRDSSMTHGSSHYWGVWWGLEPPSKYLSKVPRFMSEFGLQSLPSLYTIRSFQSSNHDTLYSKSLLCHQKHPTGFQNISKYLEMENLTYNNLEDLIYKSQIIQSQGISLAIEAHRRAMPYCMGTMYWQFNDCWPAISWSSVDYNGIWKALQYKVKNIYKDILISVIENDGFIEIFMVSDKRQETTGKLTISVYNIENNNLSDRIIFSKDVRIQANSSKQIKSFQIDSLLTELNNNFSNAISYNRHNVVITANYITDELVEYNNEKFISNLGELKLKKDIKIELDIVKVHEGYNINFQSSDFIAYLYFYLTDNKYHFNNNFINIYPNIKYTIFCKTDICEIEFKNQLKIKSLNISIP